MDIVDVVCFHYDVVVGFDGVVGIVDVVGCGEEDTASTLEVVIADVDIAA